MGTVCTYVDRGRFEQLRKARAEARLRDEVKECDTKICTLEYELLKMYVRRSYVATELYSMERIRNGSIQQHVKNRLLSALDDLRSNSEVEFPHIYRDVTGK